jgi:hypothetical protein
VSSFGSLTGAEYAAVVSVSALLTTVALRRGQPQGPTSDAETEEFLYDGVDLLGGGSDVEIHCEGGRTMLTGTVTHRRLKRDIGEIAWAMPRVTDVQNNLTIVPRRRLRHSGRDTESSPSSSARKPA